jgi:hypothetical protein
MKYRLLLGFIAARDSATHEVVVLPLYELIDAIKRDNVDEAKAALEKGADPNGKDFGRVTMLQLTEKYHAKSLVPLLVRAGADLYECIGPKKESLLHLAARNENVGFACALLDARLTPNLRNRSGDTPLHIAAATGQAYLTRYLISHNANALIQNTKGRTPLAVAVAADKSEIVRLLEPVEMQARRRGDHQKQVEVENQSDPSRTTPSELQPTNADHGLVAENQSNSTSWLSQIISKSNENIRPR